MDGPNVNWKFHRLLQEKLKAVHGSSLVDMAAVASTLYMGQSRMDLVHLDWGSKSSRQAFTTFSRIPQLEEKISLLQLEQVSSR